VQTLAMLCGRAALNFEDYALSPKHEEIIEWTADRHGARHCTLSLHLDEGRDRSPVCFRHAADVPNSETTAATAVRGMNDR
jgi:hypothetical protein